MGGGSSKSTAEAPPPPPPPPPAEAAPAKRSSAATSQAPPPSKRKDGAASAASKPAGAAGPTFIDELDGVGPSHAGSANTSLERKGSNVAQERSRLSRASSMASVSQRTSRSSSAAALRGEETMEGTFSTVALGTAGPKGLQRAETFNGDVFSKLLVERQFQAAASLKSPFLDPNEFVLKLPGPEEPVVDLTPVIAGKVSDLRRVHSTLDSRIAKSSTEADVAAIQVLEKSLVTMKQDLVQTLNAAPAALCVSGRVLTDQLIALCTGIIEGVEDRTSIELVALLLAKFGRSLKLGESAFQRGWCHYAAKDGKARFLVYILQLPGVCAAIAAQPTELLNLTAKHERCRIPMIQIMLRFAVPLGFHKRKNELEGFWEELLDDVANSRRVRLSEDHTGRLSLVLYLCTTPDVVRVNHERHRKDGFNVFLRACRDGDADVVELLLSKGLVTDVNERAKDKDGSTALVLASLGGHKAIVEQLLKTGRVDVLMTVKDKTAYVLAQENFKNPLLIAMLRKAQRDAEPTGNASSSFTAAVVADAALSRRQSLVNTPASIPIVASRSESPEFNCLLDATTTIPSPTPPPHHDHASPPSGSAHVVASGTDTVASLPPAGGDTSAPPGALPPSYTAVTMPFQSVMELFHGLLIAFQRHAMGDEETAEAPLIKLRHELAGRLAREGSVKVPSANKDEVIDVLDRVVEQGDHAAGGADLLRAAALHLDHASFDFKAVALEQEWLSMATRNNSPQLLSILLPAVGELSEETASNIIITASKSEARLDFVRVILDNARTWRKQRAVLRPLWQQFFENIGFTTGASASEETAMRFAALDKILKCRDIEIAFETEDPDGYTMFARACAFGELELIQFMIDRRVLAEPNKALSDGTNPLLQAVAGDHVEVVELLLKTKVVDAATFLPGIGTALDAATRLKRHHRIVDALRSALGMPSTNLGANGTGRGSRRGSMRLIH